jgi:hypothetical protein
MGLLNFFFLFEKERIKVFKDSYMSLTTGILSISPSNTKSTDWIIIVDPKWPKIVMAMRRKINPQPEASKPIILLKNLKANDKK